MMPGGETWKGGRKKRGDGGRGEEEEERGRWSYEYGYEKEGQKAGAKKTEMSVISMPGDEGKACQDKRNEGRKEEWENGNTREDTRLKSKGER